ncbi:MAG: MucB/RseB C-terminal domain-containing protein [Pseudomonadota bacterium]
MHPSLNLPHLMRPLFVSVILLFAAQAHADSSIEDLLQRMASTMRTVNYEGLLLHAQGQETRTVRIFHLYDPENGERERLLSQDGPAREIVHANDRCTCIWPRSKLVINRRTPTWRGHLSPARFADTLRLAAFYEFSRGETARVAGLSCQVVKLAPRDGFRHGYRLCIHEPSGMLLRLEIMDGERRLEMNQFGILRLDPGLGEDVLRPVTDLEGFRVIDETTSPAEPYQPRWTAESLPPGYFLLLAAERSHPRNGSRLEHLVYTDGLNNVSVFIEASSDRPVRTKALTGAMRRVVRDVDGHRLTAIGEVPEAAMQMILDGLRPGDTSTSDTP